MWLLVHRSRGLFLVLVSCVLASGVLGSPEDAFPGEALLEDEVSTEYLGSNSQFFTVCSSLACVNRTLNHPAHAEKLMMYIPTINVDGDSYLSYYLGLLVNNFIFMRDDSEERTVGAHVVVLSLSHAMPGGPYGDLYAVEMVQACHENDYASFTKENCTSMYDLFDSVRVFTNNGGLYHKYLTVVVLNDSVIMASYWGIAMTYKPLHNDSLFALIHLNHEQPWLDNQKVSTAEIKKAYAATKLVFRTHYYTELMNAHNVHYIPLGPGLLETDRVALGLKTENKRFPLAATMKILNTSQRSILCSFAGSMKYKNRGNEVESSRAGMIDMLEEVPGCVFYPTDDTSVTAPLSQSEYLELALSSMFSLCPRGVGPETNRPHQVS